MNRKCSVIECDNPANGGRGFCRAHYASWWRYVDPTTILKRRDTWKGRHECVVDGCTNISSSHGHCVKHDHRLRRNGGVDILKSDFLPVCAVDGCNTHIKTDHIYCSRHYRKYLKWGDPTKSYIDFLVPRKCKVSYCHKKPDTGGFCQYHMRLNKPTDPSLSSSLEDVWGQPPYHCYLCGQEYLELSAKYFQLDHVIPRSRGGTNDKNNLKISCIRCNQCKRHLTSEEFIFMCKEVADFNF